MRFGVKNAILGAIAAAALVTLSAAQVKVPALKGRVNDYAGLLDARQTAQLENALAAFENETSNQVVLLTVPSLEGEAIEEFSMRAAEAWKLGQKGKDNGVLLTVAPNDRQVRIEVGYGLEGALTDLESSRIVRYAILPAFKEGNYYAGIAAGLDGIMKATVGEFQAPQRDKAYGRKTHSVISTVFSILFFLLLISTRTGRFLLFTSMMFGGRGGGFRGGGGGGFSGGGGGFGGGGASGRW
ncbi:MAG: TPM domain-containing protein [Deltaproteobacteria bacterium]|nr:TPM domain-containing protein [Deltaproteobacteria bacterium]